MAQGLLVARNPGHDNSGRSHCSDATLKKVAELTDYNLSYQSSISIMTPLTSSKPWRTTPIPLPGYTDGENNTDGSVAYFVQRIHDRMVSIVRMAKEAETTSIATTKTCYDKMARERSFQSGRDYLGTPAI